MSEKTEEKKETVTRQELVKNLSEKVSRLSAKDAAAVVDSIIEAMMSTLAKGEEVKISGFGKFSVKDRAARIGRNPKTGESIQLPPSRALRFKAANNVKESLNDL